MWPQAQVEFSSTGVLEQPPALAQRMIGRQYTQHNATKLHVLASNPQALVSDDNGSLVDMLALVAPGSGALMLRVVNTNAAPQALSVTTHGGGLVCSLAAVSGLVCDTLACGPLEVNTWSNATACAPRPLDVAINHTATPQTCATISLTVPPFSFTTCSSSPRDPVP